MRVKKFNSEENLQIQVADYLRLQYPNILFHSDYGSGIKLTIGQATIQKRQNGGRRAWLDMFIAHPVSKVVGQKSPAGYSARIFHGLFIELKKEGTRLKKKDGSWASEHIAEQAETIEQLRKEGYKAEFAVGFEQAKQIIDEYLGAS
jgi:hypothetical protein